MDEEEIKKLYNNYLDEIGRAGIEDYSFLLEKGDPVAYQIGLNEFIMARKTSKMISKLANTTIHQ